MTQASETTRAAAAVAASITIDEPSMRALALAVCRSAGMPSAHAELQADLLIEADLRGRASHGLMRLPRIVERIANGVADAHATGKHVWVGGARLQVDGGRGLGPVVAVNAIEAMLARLDEHGVYAAAISNNNHLGMLAWYAERVAERGRVLIALSTSEALVHPWGGRRAMLGTNPIAVGIPTADGPFVLDMATSLVAMGAVHDRASRGLPLPPGWALDADGEPTTNAERAKAGALAPFGEAKGYALGLAIELLVTAMAGSAIGQNIKGTLDSNHVCNKGDLFLVLDPSRQDGLTERLAAFLDDVRRSGDGRTVLVPGDRARRTRAAALANGISIPAALLRQLETLAAREALQ